MWKTGDQKTHTRRVTHHHKNVALGNALFKFSTVSENIGQFTTKNGNTHTELI